MNPTTNGTSEGNVRTLPHTLSIDRRSHVVITGVQDVFSFQEQEIILKIDSGEMILTGEKLHIAKLLLEDGQLHVDGHVDGVLYQSTKRREEKRHFWRRFLK